MIRLRLAFLLGFLSLGLAVPAHAYQTLNECNPVWTTQPSPWHLNQNGYSRIPIATLESIFQAGFAEWSRPCCSNWRAAYMGRTARVAEDGSSAQNVISFRETNWPRELGSASDTLAVTLTTWGYDRRGCTNLTADMTFNAANHTFATSARDGVDLLSVATHEQGHWLGLDHSRISSATMYFSYIGEGGRSLHQDDEDGVCFLYPGDCGCTSAADCEAGETCSGGVCVTAPCTSDASCADGLACDVASGRCVVPPCTSDAQCPGAQVCRAGACIFEADCATCLPCTTRDDCGSTEFVCAGEEGAEGICTRLCNTDADCPGDSTCWGFVGEEFQLCLNPDADTAGICPSSYVCSGSSDPCDGVSCSGGETCNPSTGACEAPLECEVCAPCEQPTDCPTGECYDIGGGRGACMVECSSNSDCPTATVCTVVELVGGGSVNLCLNTDAATAGFCPSDFVCGPDAEPTDRCDGVSCPAGQSCDPATGRCVGTSTPDAGTDTGGSDASGGGRGGDCPVCDACTIDSECGGAGECVNFGAGGVCVLDCSRLDCPGNTACFEVPDNEGGTRSLCLNADARTAICPASFVCDSEAGGTGSDAGGTPDTSGGGVVEDTGVSGEGTGTSGITCAAGTAGFAPLWLLGLLAIRRRRLAA